MNQEIILNALAEKVDEIFKRLNTDGSDKDLLIDIVFLSKKVHQLYELNTKSFNDLNEKFTEIHNSLETLGHKNNYTVNKTRNIDFEAVFKWFVIATSIVIFSYLGYKFLNQHKEKIETVKLKK